MAKTKPAATTMTDAARAALAAYEAVVRRTPHDPSQHTPEDRQRVRAARDAYYRELQAAK